MKDNKISSFIFEYEKKVFIILLVVFLIGFVWGSYTVFHTPLSTELNLSLNQQPLFIFKKLITSYFWLFLVTFLSGYNVVGFPIMFILLLFNGINIGVMFCSVTFLDGLKSYLFYIIILLPFLVISVLSHYFITFSSLRLSASLYNVFKEGTRYISPKVYSKPHIIKFAFYFSITIISLAFCCFILMPFSLKIL